MNSIIDKIRDQIHVICIQDCFGCANLKESLKQHTCSTLDWSEKVELYYSLAIQTLNVLENLNINPKDKNLKFAVENDSSDC